MLTKEMEIFMEENQAEVKALLWKLCEIPSPSHHEERRAAFIKEWLEMQGAEAGRPNTPMASNTFGSEMNTRLGPEAIPSFPRKTKTAGMIIIPARKATPVSKISI